MQRCVTCGRIADSSSAITRNGFQFCSETCVANYPFPDSLFSQGGASNSQEDPYQGADAAPLQRTPSRFGLIGGVVAVLLGIGAKFKVLLIPVFKFLPVILKTGGTMILSIWFYAMKWPWWFAVGFVLLIFVHECGHLVVARMFGLNAGAPVFIPFMGAFIALKDAPRNAWMEAWVGIGGPLLGSLGAALCAVVYAATGAPFFAALAYTGFFLNLFNLVPIGFLDGGRVATALSPWLWVVGLLIAGVMAFTHPNFILVMILVMSLPRLAMLFRSKTEEEKRYFELTGGQRAVMAAMYFGLVAALVLGMHFTHVPPPARY
ncbi:MAG: site-2 protease family protein [Candidatus Hydrogenedentes bacterium]|nr:site-2 protease family protein [Candidatus Hydrogenedentota bacterium]